MRLIWLIIFMTISFASKAELLNYEIMSRNKVIGSLSVKIIKDESIVSYEINSHSKLSIKVEYSYKLICIYENNELFGSTLITFLNGRVHSTVKTEKKGNHYKITKDGKTSKYFNSITYSEARMYTHEPVNKSALYSEFIGRDKSIKETGDHEYEFTNKKNGNSSDYTYENGTLKQAIVHFSVVKFSIRKI